MILCRAANPADLPDMGPAPGFTLISQEQAELSLHQLTGKVVLVAFIYTWCPDICPMLIASMDQVQDAMGDAFGRGVAFVSISIDPLRETPEVMMDYAAAFEADPVGWHFLTGELETVRAVARSFGALSFPGVDSGVDHNLLTVLIDRRGRIRVHYVSHRFDLNEMEQGLRALIAEQR